jgi:hypothetical protein
MPEIATKKAARFQAAHDGGRITSRSDMFARRIRSWSIQL